MTFLKIAALGAALLAGSAMAQPPVEGAGEVCRVQTPAVPVVNWSGKASYRAKAMVKDGKVVSVEISNLTSGVDRRANRAMVQNISEALRVAQCQPGDHVFEKTFDIEVPAATPASGAAR